MLIGQEAEITPKFESCSLDCHVSYTLYERYHRHPCQHHGQQSGSTAAAEQQQQPTTQPELSDEVIRLRIYY